MTSRAFLLITSLFLLSACGGGGGGGSSTAPPPPQLSNDASLSALSVTNATLSPEFSSETTSYSVTVPGCQNSVSISAAPTDSGASVSIAGSNLSVVDLETGPNTIEVVVTAENGTTTRTYTIQLGRDASRAIDTTLGWNGNEAISGFGDGQFIETFGQTFVVPDLTVNLDQISLWLAFDPLSGGNGLGFYVRVMEWAEDRATGPLLFETFQFLDGDQIDMTQVTVDTDGLILEAGKTYVAMISANTEFWRPDPDGQAAFVGWRSEDLTAGGVWLLNDDGGRGGGRVPREIPALTTVPWNGEFNTGELVTELVFTCAAPLISLELSDVVLEPAFDPSILRYRPTVDFDISSTVVTPTAEEVGATITVNGAQVDSGSPSAPIALAAHVYERTDIEIIVTSADGATEQKYTVSVSRRPVSVSQQAYIKASNTDASDSFGNPDAIALSDDGSTLAIAAPFEGSSATGVNGDQLDNSLGSAGAVYVFSRDQQGGWTQQAYLKASNPEASDRFGVELSLSGDGSTLAAFAIEHSAATGINGDQSDNSALAAGAVYIFERDEQGIWAQRAYVKASNTDEFDFFGAAHSLSYDGTTLAIGAINESSAATGIDGDQSDNTADGAGAVYIFSRDQQGAWTQQAYLKASNTGNGDGFGGSVSLSTDGSTLAVGAEYEDSRSFSDGNDNSVQDAGAVYIFERDEQDTWFQQEYLKLIVPGLNDQFGASVSLDASGSRLAVGAPGQASARTLISGLGNFDWNDKSAPDAGAAFIFLKSDDGAWRNSNGLAIKTSNADAGDAFGRHVSLSGDGQRLAVGARFEDSAAAGIHGEQDDNSAEDAGAAYLFSDDGDRFFRQRAYIKASNADAGDTFGNTVISGDGLTLAVGARFESSGAIGINGDQSDNSAFAAGAVYAFDLTPGRPVPYILGLTQAQAEARLVDYGYVIGDVTFESSNFYEVGDVSDQNPGSGLVTEAGTPVDIVVSTGLP